MFSSLCFIRWHWILSRDERKYMWRKLRINVLFLFRVKSDSYTIGFPINAIICVAQRMLHCIICDSSQTRGLVKTNENQHFVIDINTYQITRRKMCFLFDNRSVHALCSLVFSLNITLPLSIILLYRLFSNNKKYTKNGQLYHVLMMLSCYNNDGNLNNAQLVYVTYWNWNRLYGLDVIELTKKWIE